MRPFTLLIGAIFSSLVSANALFGENAFELLTFDSVRSFGQPALHGRSLQKRQCMATCANGGCCNTGGPCTTDGMCCSSGEIACSDGGCCKTGETCTAVNGTQVCKGAVACVAPPVTCGSACCDAGMVCVTSGANFRCQRPSVSSSSSKSSSSSSSISRPPLGNPTNRTNTVSVSFTGIASGTQVIPYVTPTTFPSASAAATAASTSSAASSATKPSLSVSGLQMLVSIAGGIGLAAALMLMN